ncbi:hypothetical protein [Inquilinus limosus]|uniref:Type II secretion system protein GspC N-terminal domain-containing protein n=1 Tax=Inquilinus limosus TaxID=171674 RepID=A0A211ZGF0_9PROT|nr:hypothetical protein [Inquilinus limosus]OWJ64348.1 hypothetical protein BWR60_25085 [Inquilinus limosus]
MRSWSPLTWIVLVVGAVAVPAAAVERAAARDSAPPDPAGSLPAVDSEPARLAPLETLTETTGRPLFAATRRPPPPEPVAEPAPAPVPDAMPEPVAPPVERTEFVLVGIVQRAEGPFILLKPKAGGPVVIAHQGDDAGGWHVDAITPTAVRLTSPAGDAKHVLFAPRPKAEEGQMGLPSPY